MKNKKNNSKQSSRSKDKDKSEQFSTSRPKDKTESSNNLKSKEKPDMIISNNFNSKFKSKDQKLNQSNISNTKNISKKPEKYVCEN